MMRCSYLVQEFPITCHGEPHVQCLKEDGHEGEHIGQNEDGRFWCWEPDLSCDCPDAGCGCVIFCEATREEVQEVRDRPPVAD